MNAKQFLESKKTEQQTKANRPFFSGGYGSSTKTAGEIFTSSQAFKNFLANGQNSSDNVSIPAFSTKALLDSTGTNGLMRPTDIIIGGAEREFTMRDLLSVAPTQNNAIDYLRETTYTNASAIAPEGTLKPESTLEFETVTSLVKVIAHHIPVTRQIVADIPSMQAHIDKRLLYGLQVTETSQILFGSGVGDNLEGIMINPNVQVFTATAGDTYIDTLRRAMTRVYNADFPPTGIILSPTDWEIIERSKDANGQYLLNSVNNGGEKRLFGIPVVVTTAMTVGSYLIGSFGLGAQLFDREEANIRISEHHSDYFTRNQLSVLCEERIALAIYRPTSFVRGTFPA